MVNDGILMRLNQISRDAHKRGEKDSKTVKDIDALRREIASM